MKQEIRTAIEAHTRMGTTGLMQLGEARPKLKQTVRRIEDYIGENYKTTPVGRCWPGDLRGKERELKNYLMNLSLAEYQRELKRGGREDG